MIDSRTSDPSEAPRSRPGAALVAVLYFLTLAALMSVAVVFGTRAAAHRASDTRTDAALIAAADAIVFAALADWNPVRARQRVGSTVLLHPPNVNGATGTLWVTRLTLRVFSLVGEVRSLHDGTMRRVQLLVRLPIQQLLARSPLVSAVDVSVGPDVRFVVADDALCGDTAWAGITTAPGAAVSLDPAIPIAERPAARVDSAAGDSAAYLNVAGSWWNDLARRADVRFEADARITPSPIVAGGLCVEDERNWGEPSDSASPCRERWPIAYASGDLTIDGGRGQGVLLVDGRLVVAGPFVFSGQIVARHGIETRADAITISGIVSAWRASSDSARSRASASDVVLTHATTLRYSRCDVEHGVASWLQPRAVRARAWMELF